MKGLAFAAVLLAPAAAEAFECHTALVLGLDASRSVDQYEIRLQRDGLAAALTAPEIVAAITPYEGVGIAAMAFEWSDPEDQIVIARWRILDSEAAIRAFATELVAGPQIARRWKTGIGSAMRFAAEAFRAAPVDCRRQVLDMSGDGPGNAGDAPKAHRNAGAFDGLVINGLVIRHPGNDQAQPPGKDPLIYYQEQVIQGPGSFIVETASYDDYPQAIRRKLLRELAPPMASR